MKQYVYQTLAKKRYYISTTRNHNGSFKLEWPIQSYKLYGCNLKNMSFEDLFEKIKYYANENSMSQLEYIKYEIEYNNYELIDIIEQDISLEKSEFVWIDNDKYEINSTNENENGSLNVYINKIKFTEEIGLKECEDFKEKVEAMKYINKQFEIMQKEILKIKEYKENALLDNEDDLAKKTKEVEDDKKSVFSEKIKRIFK